MVLTKIWEPDLENGSDFTRAARGPELLVVKTRSAISTYGVLLGTARRER